MNELNAAEEGGVMCIGGCCNGNTIACRETMRGQLYSVLPGPCAECAALAERDEVIIELKVENANLKADLEYWKGIASARVAVNIENDALREQIASLKAEVERQRKTIFGLMGKGG